MLYPGGFITGIGADLSNSSADLYDPDKGATTKAGATFMIGLEVASGGRGKAVRKVGQNLKPVLIGETMDRVIKKAKEISADWYKPTSKNKKNWMKNNRAWINKQMSDNRELLDIGIDTERQQRSKYYEMEIKEIAKRNYPIKKIK